MLPKQVRYHFCPCSHVTLTGDMYLLNLYVRYLGIPLPECLFPQLV